MARLLEAGIASSDAISILLPSSEVIFIISMLLYSVELRLGVYVYSRSLSKLYASPLQKIDEY